MNPGNHCLCNNADKCNSPTCPHKAEHLYNPKWCGPGSCRWAEGTRCVDTREEKLRDILNDYWNEAIHQDEAVDRITALFKPTNPDPQPGEPGEHAEAPGSHLNQEVSNVR